MRVDDGESQSREETGGQALQGEGQRVMKRYGSFKKVNFITGKNLASGYSSAADTVLLFFIDSVVGHFLHHNVICK